MSTSDAKLDTIHTAFGEFMNQHHLGAHAFLFRLRPATKGVLLLYANPLPLQQAIKRLQKAMTKRHYTMSRIEKKLKHCMGGMFITRDAIQRCDDRFDWRRLDTYDPTRELLIHIQYNVDPQMPVSAHFTIPDLDVRFYNMELYTTMERSTEQTQWAQTLHPDIRQYLSERPLPPNSQALTDDVPMMKQVYQEFKARSTYCATCQRSKSTTKLQRCGSCRLVAYCSTSCQRRDWSQHKICCSSMNLIMTTISRNL
jgi:hypothetical protein